jgi:hypothetical protein
MAGCLGISGSPSVDARSLPHHVENGTFFRRSYNIAVAGDDYTAPGKPPGYDAASGRWKAHLEAAGCTVKMVDVRAHDILAQLEGCDGFMWRWAHFGGMGRIARRLLPVVEREMGILTYPDQNTCWHYDDKIAQSMLFKVHDIPTPRTWVFFDRDECVRWLETSDYPLVADFGIPGQRFH